jgi:Ca-activated chloride channel family protein
MPFSAVRALAVVALGSALVATTRAQSQDEPRFTGGVELVNVTATVTDRDGRFVSGLGPDDFRIYEDDVLQEVSSFDSERTAVSLGIALDASGSMTDDKMSAARAAIRRFIFNLLAPDDELFFEQFANRADITQGWTTERRAIDRALATVDASGGTALYDAVAEGLPLASRGRHTKKAILVISDGNDTNSHITVDELQRRTRESEVLVYALGVDSTAREPRVVRRAPLPAPTPFPFPFPGRGGRPGRQPFPIPLPPTTGGGVWTPGPGQRVNADALRLITDDTGGRTEIVRGFENLDDATGRIADELSRQYSLGYISTGKRDGRWHVIRVEVRDPRLTVRARRGFIAS